MFQPPAAARRSAQQVLTWRRQHGSDVRGMTEVGWRRARQLASGRPVSRATVAAMSQFARHRANATVAPELRRTPWRDAGHVAWLGWGGDAGVDWARDTMKHKRRNNPEDCQYCQMLAATMYGRRSNASSPAYRLLTDNNPKIAKGIAAGWYTAVLHLAPADVSGFIDTCPFASEGCRAACLNTSGQGGIAIGQAKKGSSRKAKARLAKLTAEADVIAPDRRKDVSLNDVVMARIRRTARWVSDPAGFISDLRKDISLAKKHAAARGLRLAIRLNGTSDIVWEKKAPELFSEFSDVQFYDYTKIPKRMRDWAEGKLPRNYHLTFSRSESNAAQVLMLPTNANVAVVFTTKPKAPLPKVWAGRTVIDGDETDLRFLDPPGVIVGLRAKGKARKASYQASGFVVRANPKKSGRNPFTFSWTPRLKNAARRCNPTLMTLSNPYHTGNTMDAARQAYETFHEMAPQKTRDLGGDGPPLVALGELIEVVYKPTRGARRGPAFVHEFARGAVLAATPDGRELVLLPSPKKPFRVDWQRGIVG